MILLHQNGEPFLIDENLIYHVGRSDNFPQAVWLNMGIIDPTEENNCYPCDETPEEVLELTRWKANTPKDFLDNYMRKILDLIETLDFNYKGDQNETLQMEKG